MRVSTTYRAFALFPFLAVASYSSYMVHAQRGLRSRADVERSISDLAAFNKHAAVAKRTNNVTDSELDACPGYTASNVRTTAYSLSADLNLAGPACNVYGPDLRSLGLKVTYETRKYFVHEVLDGHLVSTLSLN
jgi:hypothetical protein